MDNSAEPRQLLIFPCNGNAIEALDCVGSAYEFAGFVDDTSEKQLNGAFGHRVFPREELEKRTQCAVIAVPGSPATFTMRKSLIESLAIDADRFVRLVHDSAQISKLATIGFNVVAMAGVVVTSNAVVGDHVCILPNSVVHHDANIGNWSLVGSNVTIAGGVDVGENCYIGSGTSIKNGVRIGKQSLIGLGSTVIEDIPNNTVVAGNPARALRKIDQ